ncbi:MAG TPA: asparagine synthase (glutamine-hydrolyzing) [Ideonella sp.]|uniref:asparagine synthase (glutamine-hydrolyzing) n=1 Tax=Ideonella sp. TaxID=1929293 RepID=UPI002E34884C|nr:asparagine synthase (glutamine-hydrolyzing) [Ideonella sp.]HEX5686072.1 asparagine synthase (glutamine-hydrolyzing) [Ideonella sp.]
MCGIAGILSVDGSHPPAAAQLATMIGQLHHRGPDDTGMWCQGEIGLAHARLSIIDPTGGHQPMASADGLLQVVFNGEIFNFVELRAALEAAGRCFRTRSDTEVLLHLYALHGDRFVEHLNGQFAIALWDVRRRRLVLARDRAGIRPLYFAWVGRRLLFASEIKALFAIAEMPRRLDPRGLAEAFTFWSPLAPQTAFDGVQQLPPGHLMWVGGGQQRTTCYWDWEFPPHGAEDLGRAEDLADELRERLVDAVRLQLRADVPVGAYLSGGLDSSVITTLIHRCTDTPLRSFSLAFDEHEFDERSHQRELVDHLGTPHTELRCSRADIAAGFPKAVWHAEAPLLRTAPVPMMLLARSVREHGVKVVLTGEGADEVFGGYDLFKEARVRRFMARAPQSRWRGRLLQRLYPWMPQSPGASGALAQRYFGDGNGSPVQPTFGHAPRWLTSGRITRFFTPALRDAVAGFDPIETIERTLPSTMQHWSPLARDQYVEAHTLMSGYLLGAQGDRMAMAGSVEARFPFLDHRLIEFANRLPPRYKLMGLTEKYLLKRAMKGLLPESIRLRAKQPYRTPDSSSFFGANGQPDEACAELLSESRLVDAGLFDPGAVRRLLAKCAAGRAAGFGDNMAFVGILSTMWLHELFVRARPLPAATAG